MLEVAAPIVADNAAPMEMETAMSERSDIVHRWDKMGFALYAAWMLSLPGGLLLALAGMPGVAMFSLACFCGFVVATLCEESARLDAEHHRDAP